MDKAMFSVLILTFNEEQNIGKCLDQLKLCDDIFIVDSFSTDNTLKIIEKYPGIKLKQRKFDNFANQRNFALDNFDFKYKWVLHLDADETTNNELIDECNSLAGKDEKSAYYIAGKLIFMNKWIKYASCFPVYQMRFMKIGEACFKQQGHGQIENTPIRGTGYIKSNYNHYNFSKGISDWIERHNKYSTDEAIEELTEGKLKITNFLKGKIERRRELKKFSHKLPCRPFFRFFFTFIIKQGIFDGREGYIYCKLLSMYEQMIVTKKTEIRKMKRV